MKHKHYDMIVAKAENMDLVVFSKNESGWRESGLEDIVCWPSYEHFLCLPQHKETCLHWLNGGEIEYKSKGYWRSSKSWPSYTVSEFGAINYFTSESSEVRIKPKKEKRWIAYSADQKRLGCLTFDSEMEARNHYIHEVDEPQFIEIEVEA